MMPHDDHVQGSPDSRSWSGTHLGYSDYMEITQERVNTFAEATGDHQWIHVDPERAKAETPFGGPIAHGYLTLSLGPVLAPQVMRVEGFKMGVNYGCEKVRFPSPVPVGSNLRFGAHLDGVEDIPGGCPGVDDLHVRGRGRAEAVVRDTTSSATTSSRAAVRRRRRYRVGRGSACGACGSVPSTTRGGGEHTTSAESAECRSGRHTLVRSTPTPPRLKSRSGSYREPIAMMSAASGQGGSSFGRPQRRSMTRRTPRSASS